MELFTDNRGELCSLEFGELPFTPRRIYFISNVPVTSSRGGHAHRKLRQAFICLAGTVDLKLEDGQNEETIKLSANRKVTTIGPYIWRELHNFSSDSIILVLADQEFSEADYIRDKTEFLNEINGV